MITRELIKDVTITLLERAETILPGDVQAALARAYEREVHEIAKVQLEAMLENVRLAGEMRRPLCQDTGLPLFFVRLGPGICTLREIELGIQEGVREATERIPLRSNVVDALTRVGSGANIGEGIPSIEFESADIDGVEIIALPKGGGSENVSVFTILAPKPEKEARRAITQFVLEAVLKAAGKPCPPTIIGIGIGGSADMAMKLAKRALIRPVGVRNREARVAEFEEELLAAVNRTGIGPMGLGGKTTALDLHIETAATHLTSLPVGVVFQCWAARRAAAWIDSKGRVVYY